MQNRHSLSRAAITVAFALTALVAAAAAGAAMSADPTPAPGIDWKAINDAASQQVTFN